MYYLSDASQEAQMDQAVSSLISSLNLSGKNEYQKAKAIYDYMCSNITYDYKNLNDPNYTLKFSAYAALINKTSVCQGYATLFYRLALEAGLDARVIAGVAGGGNHAWNIVKINGSYYNLDSTWDAGRDPYDYFLKNMDDFFDHDRNADYTASDFVTAYPMSATSYDESAPVYGEPTYEWAADYSSVTAKRLCETDGTYETETVETTKEVTDPTCTKDGSITYRAVFTNAAFKAQTKTVAGAKAFGHDFQNDICTRCNARRTGAWVHPDPDGGIATAMVPIRQMNYARSAIPGLALTLPDGWRLAGLLTITTGTTSHPAVLCRPDGWHTASPGIISMEPVK